MAQPNDDVIRKGWPIVFAHPDGRRIAVWADRKIRYYGPEHRTPGAPLRDEWPILWRADVPALSETEWYAPPGDAWQERSLYADLLATGVPLDNHESDLYVKDTPEARRVFAYHGITAQQFISKRDGLPWFDVPFRYDPFWDRAIGDTR